VLACAGLARLGCLHAVTQVFEPEEMLPAPGQGALRWSAGTVSPSWRRCSTR